MTRQALLSGGYMEPSALACEGSIVAVKSITERGIWLMADNVLYLIQISSPDTLTKSGAHVGMSMKELVALYGADVQRQTVFMGENNPVQAYAINGPRNTLYFLSEAGTVNPSDRISSMVLKPSDGYGIPSESC